MQSEGINIAPGEACTAQTLGSLTPTLKCNEGLCSSSALTPPTRLPTEKPPASIGDIVFDTGTYALLGGVVNFFASMAFGYDGRYGKTAPLIKRLTQGMEHAGLSRSTAENAAMSIALGSGGSSLVIPIKFLEDNRKTIVQYINKHTGCAAAATDDPPPQSWGSLIKGRIISYLTVFAAFKGAGMAIGPEKFEKFEHDFAREVICKPLNRPTHIAGQETKLYRLGRIGALDIFATTASATLLYVASRFFARKNQIADSAEAPGSATQEPMFSATNAQQNEHTVTEKITNPKWTEIHKKESRIPLKPMSRYPLSSQSGSECNQSPAP